MKVQRKELISCLALGRYCDSELQIIDGELVCEGWDGKDTGWRLSTKVDADDQGPYPVPKLLGAVLKAAPGDYVTLSFSRSSMTVADEEGGVTRLMLVAEPHPLVKVDEYPSEWAPAVIPPIDHLTTQDDTRPALGCLDADETATYAYDSQIMARAQPLAFAPALIPASAVSAARAVGSGAEMGRSGGWLVVRGSRGVAWTRLPDHKRFPIPQAFAMYEGERGAAVRIAADKLREALSTAAATSDPYVPARLSVSGGELIVEVSSDIGEGVARAELVTADSDFAFVACQDHLVAAVDGVDDIVTLTVVGSQGYQIMIERPDGITIIANMVRA